MKTGNTPTRRAKPIQHRDASMEPGHEDREYLDKAVADAQTMMEPQWSPVMKTGNTHLRHQLTH